MKRVPGLATSWRCSVWRASGAAAANTAGPITFDSPIRGGEHQRPAGLVEHRLVRRERRRHCPVRAFGFGQALQISNAKTSGSFGDQTFARQLVDPAGRVDATHFQASFEIGTTLIAMQQPGLYASVSPDYGQRCAG